ncbi:MAG TPA: L-aspartate oxidase [Lentisphaeria bacterium]|nr:MAG: L-aspartate oxidase [Lentisphaerae bacterium GWF2_49_21]HBC86541.1 L-aspartate oxidase [Lentisphaeria bacterium]
MSTKEVLNFDHIVVGSGLAGLFTALQLSKLGSVAVITKRSVDEANTKYAQGGIACVMDTKQDSFDEHLRDTMVAGDHLCKENIVKTIVENGPAAIKELIDLGAHFTTRGEMGHQQDVGDFDLGREGGHTQRRVLHSGDITGEEVEKILIKACRANPNIKIFEYHIAIDLITSGRLGWMGEDCVLGTYVLDIRHNIVKTVTSMSITIATGGTGKVYLYTSNPDIASGDGIAMCSRAHVPIANMEFLQFHPTILYHPKVKSFLISEAVRGEGAILKRLDAKGNLVEFMDQYHKMASLAPRDIVARAIDNELKRIGQPCAFLDIRHKKEEFLKRRFPNIFGKCLEVGINMAKDPIPVVPAAHYCCGGVKTDINGFTGLAGLYAVGEVASTGLHGANRLASNSLLEALVIAKFAAKDIKSKMKKFSDERPSGKIPTWRSGNATNSDELVVIAHNWDEIRRFMWDYVGIFRTNKRLERAKNRIKNIRSEIEKYYWDFLITPDLVELRNIATVAEIIIDSAMSRKESRGLHFNADYPQREPKMDYVDTIIQEPYT